MTTPATRTIRSHLGIAIEAMRLSRWRLRAGWIYVAHRTSRFYRKSFPRSMSSEPQCLQRQENRLHTKDQRVNEGHRIDDLQVDFLQRTDVLRFKLMVMIGIEICNAAAARRNIVEPAFVERFEKNRDRARGAELRHVGQLIGLQDL